mmetsp:Transcript_626/g.1460  ORF Transcript_626/g.1460 Transcript_626/m.1460 type:complete len:351 (-) Transcript_626:207-1259(-)
MLNCGIQTSPSRRGRRLVDLLRLLLEGSGRTRLGSLQRLVLLPQILHVLRQREDRRLVRGQPRLQRLQPRVARRDRAPDPRVPPARGRRDREPLRRLLLPRRRLRRGSFRRGRCLACLLRFLARFLADLRGGFGRLGSRDLRERLLARLLGVLAELRARHLHAPQPRFLRLGLQLARHHRGLLGVHSGCRLPHERVLHQGGVVGKSSTLPRRAEGRGRREDVGLCSLDRLLLLLLLDQRALLRRTDVVQRPLHRAEIAGGAHHRDAPRRRPQRKRPLRLGLGARLHPLEARPLLRRPEVVLRRCLPGKRVPLPEGLGLGRVVRRPEARLPCLARVLHLDFPVRQVHDVEA